MDSEVNYEYREVKLPTGITQKGRDRILEKEIKKMEKIGWVFEDYHDGGSSQASRVRFKRKIMQNDHNSDGVSAGSIIATMILIFIAYQIYSYFSDASKEDAKRNREIAQGTYYIRFFDEPISKLKKMPLYDLKEVSKSFAHANNLQEKEAYDCLGYMIYRKSDTIKTKEILGMCYQDLMSKNKRKYYNIAWLLDDFSPWDGSYRPLEKIIKESMNDPSSYEHVKTLYGFVFYGKKITRPYMNIVTEYRGKNAYGAIIKAKTTAKVDAVTKEIFDIE